jgi:hypothetical protein
MNTENIEVEKDLFEISQEIRKEQMIGRKESSSSEENKIKEQKTPAKKKNLWRKFPHWVVDKNILLVLTPSELKLYAVYNRYADFRSGVGRVNNKQASKRTGIHIKNVPGCSKGLEYWGLIKSYRKGWKKMYEIQMSPPGEIDEKVAGISGMKLKSDRALTRDPHTGKFNNNSP